MLSTVYFPHCDPVRVVRLSTSTILRKRHVHSIIPGWNNVLNIHNFMVLHKVHRDVHVFREGYRNGHAFHKMHHYVLVLRHVRNLLKLYLQMHVPREYYNI